jgi:hypothetical protein
VSVHDLTAAERRIALALLRHSAHPALIDDLARILAPADPAAFRSVASSWHPWFENSPAGSQAYRRWIESGQLG